MFVHIYYVLAEYKGSLVSGISGDIKLLTFWSSGGFNYSLLMISSFVSGPHCLNLMQFCWNVNGSINIQTSEGPTASNCSARVQAILYHANLALLHLQGIWNAPVFHESVE